jgi:HEXXH motif-containing protein
VLPQLLCLAAGITDPAARVAQAIPNFLAAMPQTPPEAFLWDFPIHRLTVPRLGRSWDFEFPARGLVIDPLGIEVRHADDRLERLPLAAGQTPFHALNDDLHLSTLDTHPLSHHEAHPDKSGNAVDLGGRTVSDWQTALGEALSLIEQALPNWYAELSTSLKRLIPVGFEPERHLSASYREAPGIAWLTLHPDPLTLAEAIVHETQHSKLNLASWLDPVLLNGHSTWTESPVRPDLRPLMGVLLAAHAFVPVAAMHASLVRSGHALSRTARFKERRAQVLESNGRGLRVVQELGEPTALGARLIRELGRVHGVLVDQASR